jgi:protein TonB
MFEQSLLQNSAKSGWRKLLSVALSVAFQCLTIAAMILSPMIFTEGIPKIRAGARFIMPEPPPRLEIAPQPAGGPRHGGFTLRPQSTIAQQLTPPRIIPSGIDLTPDALPAPPDFVGTNSFTDRIGDCRGAACATLFASDSGRGVKPPEPPAPQPVHTVKLDPTPVSRIENSRILFRPQPVYPPMARQTRVQGTVRLEAIISRSGLIENLRVLSGHPLLVKAALDAVAQWRYRPTLLNGEAVEVITTVEVNFTLNQ